MSFQGVMYLFQYVTDLELSAQFYGDKLGFKPDTVEGQTRGFQFGTGHLAIHAENRAEADRVYQGGGYQAVQVEDVDAYHAELKERGVEVSEVRDWPWGERSFRVADPDGYVWTFASV